MCGQDYLEGEALGKLNKYIVGTICQNEIKLSLKYNETLALSEEIGARLGQALGLGKQLGKEIAKMATKWNALEHKKETLLNEIANFGLDRSLYENLDTADLESAIKSFTEIKQLTETTANTQEQKIQTTPLTENFNPYNTTETKSNFAIATTDKKTEYEQQQNTPIATGYATQNAPRNPTAKTGPSGPTITVPNNTTNGTSTVISGVEYNSTDWRKAFDTSSKFGTNNFGIDMNNWQPSSANSNQKLYNEQDAEKIDKYLKERGFKEDYKSIDGMRKNANIFGFQTPPTKELTPKPLNFNGNEVLRAGMISFYPTKKEEYFFGHNALFLELKNGKKLEIGLDPNPRGKYLFESDVSKNGAIFSGNVPALIYVIERDDKFFKNPPHRMVLHTINGLTPRQSQGLVDYTNHIIASKSSVYGPVSEISTNDVDTAKYKSSQRAFEMRNKNYAITGTGEGVNCSNFALDGFNFIGFDYSHYFRNYPKTIIKDFSERKHLFNETIFEKKQ